MGKKHPLDIFRASGAGFDSATRERRTVMGRVVASAPRAGTAASGAPGAPAAGSASAPAAGDLSALPPAVAAMRARVMGPTASAPALERVADPAAFTRPLRPPLAPRSPAPAPEGAAAAAAPPAPTPARPPLRTETPAARPAQRPAPKATAKAGPKAASPAEGGRPSPVAINRKLLASACVLVGGLALWTLFAAVGGPALKSSAPVAGVPAFCVQAAVYPGTPAGQAAAFDARDWLRQQGFPDVDVVGQRTDKADVYSRFDLVVGRGGSEAALGDVLSRLQGVRSWPGTPKAPFTGALVVPDAR